MGWSCLSTAASRPSEFAPDRGKWLTVRLRGSRSRQDVYASIQEFEPMTRIAWGGGPKISRRSPCSETDIRNTLPRFADAARQANHNLVQLIGEIAKRKKATPAQVALAWLLAQKPWIVPIPGTAKLHRLEENVGGALVDITADDLREIGEVLAKVPVQGARYSEAMQKLVNR
jgi:Aldo/keto reductase family